MAAVWYWEYSCLAKDMFIKMNGIVVDVKIDATWIWDAQLCRMDWANAEGLAFIGLESLAGLQKIRYNSQLSWVQQLNTLSEMALPDTGGMEKIAFPDGVVLNCWVKNHQTENGHKGLWIILKEDQKVSVPDHDDVALKKTNEVPALEDKLPLEDKIVTRQNMAAEKPESEKASFAQSDSSLSGTSERSAQEQEKSESGKILALIARQINAKTGNAVKKVRVPSAGIAPEGLLAVQDNVSRPAQDEEGQARDNQLQEDRQGESKPGHGLPGMAELVKQMKRVEAVPVNDNEADAALPPAVLQGDGAEQAPVLTARNSEGIQDAVLVSETKDKGLPETQDRANQAVFPKQDKKEAVTTQPTLADTSVLPIASAISDGQGNFNASSELFALALGYHNEDDFLKNASLAKVLPQVYEKLIVGNGGTLESQLFEKSEALTKSGRKVSLSLSVKTRQAEDGIVHYFILYPEGIPQAPDGMSEAEAVAVEPLKAADKLRVKVAAEKAKIAEETVEADEGGAAASVAENARKVTQDEKSKPSKPARARIQKAKTQKTVKKPRPKAGKGSPRKQEPKKAVVRKPTPPKVDAVTEQTESDSISDDYERTLPFLAKVSHEIRTPLNSIIGFSEIMKEEQFGPIKNERYLGYLDDIFVSANHALSLVNDMLDISRIQAGSMEMERKNLDLNEEVHSAIKSMAPQFANKEIHVWQGLSEESLPILCDKRSLRQIVLNLVSNAVKYTPKGGQITVSTALEKEDKVVLRVRDTGIGMSEADIRQAMKPFQRLDTILRHETNGSGLGLPLTKALIEANKADFKIESAVDKGTLVSVTFSKAL